MTTETDTDMNTDIDTDIDTETQEVRTENQPCTPHAEDKAACMARIYVCVCVCARARARVCVSVHACVSSAGTNTM